MDERRAGHEVRQNIISLAGVRITYFSRYFIRQYTGLPYPDPSDDAAVKHFVIPAWKQSLTTSILSAGTFFGAIVAGDIADFIGRRLTIIMGCGIFIIGCILEVASTGLGLSRSSSSYASPSNNADICICYFQWCQVVSFAVLE